MPRALFMLFWLPVFLHAGSLCFHVDDPANEPLPFAKVALKAPGQPDRFLETNAEGNACWRDLPAGTYDAEISARSFITVQRKGIQVVANLTSPVIHAKLSLGNILDPDLEDKFEGEARISSTVRRASGPLTNARVCFVASKAPVATRKRIDSAGPLLFAGPASGGNLVSQHCTNTDQRGNFGINIPAGYYEIKIYKTNVSKPIFSAPRIPFRAGTYADIFADPIP